MKKKVIHFLFLLFICFVIKGDTNQKLNESQTKIIKKPRVSIITSIYNGDLYIEHFLKDITRQTIFNECELILLNANSPGNEEKIIKKYLSKYPNIIYKKFNQRLTIYKTWNIGIELSSSDLITNANLDDRRAPNSLEEHAKALENNPQIDLVYADYYLTLIPNQTFEQHHQNMNRMTVQGDKHPNYFLRQAKKIQKMSIIIQNAEFDSKIMYSRNVAGPFPMWRKNLHEKFGYFREEFIALGDWEMWLRASAKHAKFKRINQVLDLYYLNPKGLSSDLSTGKVRQEMGLIKKEYSVKK